MAGRDKLVGRLTLDVGALRGQIQEANNLLGTLGQGVSLDMTRAVQERINALMATMRTASTQTRGGGGGGGALQEAQAINRT